jgi:hypothetical protein
MVKFSYKPWNEFIIHEVVKYPLEHFLATHSIGVSEGGIGRPLNWSNGIIFDHQVMRPTDDIIKEQIAGKVHWSYLGYALLDNYRSEFIRPGRIRIPVINLSDNMIFSSMAEWIKENFE